MIRGHGLQFDALIPLAFFALVIALHVGPGIVREAWRNRKFPGRCG